MPTPEIPQNSTEELFGDMQSWPVEDRRIFLESLEFIVDYCLQLANTEEKTSETIQPSVFGRLATIHTFLTKHKCERYEPSIWVKLGIRLEIHLLPELFDMDPQTRAAPVKNFGREIQKQLKLVYETKAAQTVESERLTVRKVWQKCRDWWDGK